MCQSIIISLQVVDAMVLSILCCASDTTAPAADVDVDVATNTICVAITSEPSLTLLPFPLLYLMMTP